MSLATWKTEHVIKLPKRATIDQMLNAALQKYIGGRKTNLEKHGCHTSDGCVWAHGSSSFDFADNCELCRQYRTMQNSITFVCAGCPLDGPGDRSCGYRPAGESPWHAWLRRSYPEPMIRLIRRAIKKRETGK